MRTVATREDGGLWSAATAAKLICFRLPLEQAIAAVVKQTGLSREEAAAEFQQMTLPEWYSVWSSAVHFSIQYQELLAEENEVLGKDVTEARAEIEKLKATMEKREREYALNAAWEAVKVAEDAVQQQFNDVLNQGADKSAQAREMIWNTIKKHSDKWANLVRLRKEYDAQIIQKG